MKHLFVFTPGRWNGEGTITFSMADDVLEFTTEWVVLPEENGKIYFYQVVEMKGFSEKMRNHYCIEEITEKGFDIQLENNIVGKVRGKGVFTPQVIAWEFRDKAQGMEGFEIYELKEGIYQMRAEFTADEELKTQIKGTIQKDS